MQNASNQTGASLGQARQILDNRTGKSIPLLERDLKISLWQGHGARAELEQLAERYGNARSRRLNALSGRRIDGAELAEIYHANFARAATATESAPDFTRPEWQEALTSAQREADAAHYVHARDSRRMVSRDNSEDDVAISLDDSAAFLDWSARSCRRGSLRPLVRHARECLVAHWSLSSSRTWRAALIDDLARLATLARVARGASFGEFGDYSDFNSSAARKSFQRLAARMASGDLMLTDNPETAQRSIDDWQSRRAWAPSPDYMIATA
jgi:hypothetical protein